MENHLRFFDVYWAAVRSGLYLVPVNHHLTADESAYIVNDSGARRSAPRPARPWRTSPWGTP